MVSREEEGVIMKGIGPVNGTQGCPALVYGVSTDLTISHVSVFPNV